MRKLETRDLFAMARLVSQLELKNDFKKIFTDEQTSTGEYDLGFDVIFSVLDKFAQKNAEGLFYEFLSGPFECTREEVEKMDLFTLFEAIKEIADVEQWLRFLKGVIK